jgi:transposase
VIVIGTDSHKRTHTVVAVDQVGRRLGERTVRATSDGHLELVRWSAPWPQVTFALEDCRHLTRRLEQDLLAAGQAVVRVPTRLMARGVRKFVHAARRYSCRSPPSRSRRCIRPRQASSAPAGLAGGAGGPSPSARCGRCTL